MKENTFSHFLISTLFKVITTSGWGPGFPTKVEAGWLPRHGQNFETSPTELLLLLGVSPLFLTPSKKSVSSPFPSFLSPSLPWLQTIYWTKLSLIAFRHTLPKRCAFSILQSQLTWKCSFGLNHLIQNSVLQDYLAELNLTPSSFVLRKVLFSFILLCCLYQVWIDLPLPKNFCVKHWGWREKPVQQPKICSFPPPEKSLSRNSNIHTITQYKLHL